MDFLSGILSTFDKALLAVNKKSPTVKISSLLWSIFFCSSCLGLSLAVIFSCHSSQTSALNLLSVRPLPLIHNLFHGIIANGSRNDQAVAGVLPDEYLLGITGLCRKWKVSNHVDCLPAFPQNPDILTAVLEDLSSSSISNAETAVLFRASSTYSAKQSLWTALGTASSVLLITSIIWMSGVAIYIWFLPRCFNLSLVLILMNMVLAHGAAGIWTGMAVDQAFTFNSPTAPAQDLSLATSLGPGFYMLWVFAACTLLVTPSVALLVLLMFALIIGIGVIFAIFSIFALWAMGGVSFVSG